jgi:hypothetical protein
MSNNITGELTKVQAIRLSTSCATVTPATTYGTNYANFGYLKSVTPPKEERETVDASNLDESEPIQQVGAKQPQEFSFTNAWDPGDDDHDHLQDAFDNKCNMSWRIMNTNWTSTAHTFTGRVIALEPGEIQRSGIITRSVRVARSSAITYA